jgi:hypothetical protein
VGNKGQAPLAAYIAFQLTELEGQLPLIAAADPEAAHNARLALRRLRSVLSCYRGMIPKLPRPAREEVSWKLPAPGWPLPLARTSATNARCGLQEPRYWKCLAPGNTSTRRRTSPSASRHGGSGCSTASRSRRPAATRRCATLRSTRHARTSSASASVEAVADASSPQASGVIQPAIGLQRLLGDQHDAVVAREWIRGLAKNPGIDSEDAQRLESIEVRRRLNAEEEFRMAIAEYPVPAPRRALIF